MTKGTTMQATDRRTADFAPVQDSPSDRLMKLLIVEVQGLRAEQAKTTRMVAVKLAPRIFQLGAHLAVIVAFLVAAGRYFQVW